MKINRATLKNLPDIFNLLIEFDLPVQGVIDHFRNFFVLRVKGKICGSVGLEIHQNSCILRSLAVTGTEQGKGYGRNLVEEVFRLIKRKNMKRIYLLTTDAVDYFKRFDFKIINRDEVDSEIQKSLQFTSLCCQSAACMIKII